MLPEMSAYISGSIYDKVSSSNSWTTALLEATRRKIELSLVMFYSGDKLIDKTFDDIRCFAIPRKKSPYKYDKRLNKYLVEVDNAVHPDVVHVHGTEYPHSYNAIEVFGADRSVISIQGLISVIARYYMSGISTWNIVKNLTIRNIVFQDSALGQKKTFTKRGEWEVRVIKSAKHIIGRTDWDMIHSKTINPAIRYYHLDELMRQEFWESRKWNYEECNKHTIFISQSSYPIKGLHMMLKALNVVKSSYPDVKLRIAGKPFLNHKKLIEKLSYSGYAKYLNSLIKEYNLQDSVVFTGFKDAQGMVDEYLKANVYVGPSCIENSPNSMCEAQLLGVPCVVSDVGGVYDMTNHGKTAFVYRFEEYEILAFHICEIFKNPKVAEEKIADGIILAETRHDKGIVIRDLLKIYGGIGND